MQHISFCICFLSVATSFGDPHIVTLDHVEYTFNGYGEYQILRVSGPEFSLQGRMQPLITEDGVKSNATVYKAFAMKEEGSDLIQVMPTNAKTAEPIDH